MIKRKITEEIKIKMYQLLNNWFQHMLKIDPQKLAIELKQRIKVIEEVPISMRNHTLINALKWCRQKQFELARIL